MFQVAGRARGRESLARMMDWGIVTRQACLVADLFEKRSRLRHVTETALLRKDCMRGGEGAAGICFLSALGSLGQKPTECEYGHCHREPETPASKRMRAREILKIDTPCKLFGSTCPSQHRALEPHRHDGMPCPQQKQGIR